MRRTIRLLESPPPELPILQQILTATFFTFDPTSPLGMAPGMDYARPTEECSTHIPFVFSSRASSPQPWQERQWPAPSYENGVYVNPRLDPKNYLEGELSVNPATRLRQMLARPGIVVGMHSSGDDRGVTERFHWSPRLSAAGLAHVVSSRLG